jgi:hypothetical protein
LVNSGFLAVAAAAAVKWAMLEKFMLFQHSENVPCRARMLFMLGMCMAVLCLQRFE